MKKLFAVLLLVIASASSAFAVDPAAALWAAVDVSALQTNVITILTALVAIPVIFLGYRYLKRSLRAG